MAKMLPPQFDGSTVSAAERRLFDLIRHDPATADWVVLHSLGLSRRGKKPYGEVDFVVLIPSSGVFCLEVKGGRVACKDGVWETEDRFGRIETMNRSPFLQAREGMFEIRDAIQRRAPADFPSTLVYGYAVVMPDIQFDEQSTEWERWQAIDKTSLSRSVSEPIRRLAARQRELLGLKWVTEPSAATVRVISKLLRPDFEAVVSTRTTIDACEAQLIRLTEEQFASLDLLADNERCLFEGAAGTGKTLLAFEYARRSAASGQRTLLLCFNRLLGDWLGRQACEESMPSSLVSGSYFKYLRDLILRSSIASDFLRQEEMSQGRELYETVYPLCGRLAAEELRECYDVLVVDEAQDLLQHGVLDVFNVLLNEGLANGRWALFADFQRQAIFGTKRGEQLKADLDDVAPRYAKGRLRVNCRNTRNIGEETALLAGFESPPYRIAQIAGLPVNYRYYRAADEQCVLVAEEVGRLLEAGVRAADIVILSRLRLEHSGIAHLDGGRTFRVADADFSRNASRVPVIRYCTVQAFKGMESPVVILCDVEEVADSAPQCMLYVAMSRARSQLIVLVTETSRSAIAACFRRTLEQAWGSNE